VTKAYWVDGRVFVIGFENAIAMAGYLTDDFEIIQIEVVVKFDDSRAGFHPNDVC